MFIPCVEGCLYDMLLAPYSPLVSVGTATVQFTHACIIMYLYISCYITSCCGLRSVQGVRMECATCYFKLTPIAGFVLLPRQDPRHLCVRYLAQGSRMAIRNLAGAFRTISYLHRIMCSLQAWATRLWASLFCNTVLRARALHTIRRSKVCSTEQGLSILLISIIIIVLVLCRVDCKYNSQSKCSVFYPSISPVLGEHLSYLPVYDRCTNILYPMFTNWSLCVVLKRGLTWCVQWLYAVLQALMCMCTKKLDAWYINTLYPDFIDLPGSTD